MNYDDIYGRPPLDPRNPDDDWDGEIPGDDDNGDYDDDDTVSGDGYMVLREDELDDENTPLKDRDTRMPRCICGDLMEEFPSRYEFGIEWYCDECGLTIILDEHEQGILPHPKPSIMVASEWWPDHDKFDVVIHQPGIMCMDNGHQYAIMSTWSMVTDNVGIGIQNRDVKKVENDLGVDSLNDLELRNDNDDGDDDNNDEPFFEE